MASMDDLIGLFKAKKEARFGEVQKADLPNRLLPTLEAGYAEPDDAYIAEGLKAIERIKAMGQAPLTAKNISQADVDEARRAFDVGTSSGGIKYSKELGPKVVKMGDEALQEAKEFIKKKAKIEPEIPGEKVVAFDEPKYLADKEERIKANIERAIERQKTTRVHKPEFDIFPKPYEEPRGKLLKMEGPEVEMFRQLMDEMKTKSEPGQVIPYAPKLTREKLWDLAASKSEEMAKQKVAESKVELPESAYKDYSELVSKESLIDLFSPQNIKKREEIQRIEMLKPKGELGAKVTNISLADEFRRSGKSGGISDVLNDLTNEHGALTDESLDEMQKFLARFGSDKKKTNAVLNDLDKIGKTENLYSQSHDKTHLIPNFELIRSGKIPKILGNPESSASYFDAFGWIDTKYQIGKTLLTRAKSLGKPVTINTGSDLIAQDDYIAQIPKGSKVTMWITGINPTAQKIILPGKASDKRVLEAAAKLKQNGIDVEIKAYDKKFLKSLANQKNLNESEFDGLLNPKKVQDAE